MILLSTTSLSQQAAAAGEPLTIHTGSLPKALLRQQYRFELRAEGGISPLHWEVTGGSMPDGLALGPDGVLSGVPIETGDFRFTVTEVPESNTIYRARLVTREKLVVPPIP